MFNKLKKWNDLRKRKIKIKKEFWEKHKKYLPKYDCNNGNILNWKVELSISKKYDSNTGEAILINIVPHIKCSSYNSIYYSYNHYEHKTYSYILGFPNTLIYDGEKNEQVTCKA